MTRNNWLPPDVFAVLNAHSHLLVTAWGGQVYLVGSALRTRDYRDIDLRHVLPDKRLAALFGTAEHPMLALAAQIQCSAMSQWLGRMCGAKVDYQVQSKAKHRAETETADAVALGWFLAAV